MLDALQIVDQQKIFYDPNISQPPDFQAKNLSLICRLIRKYLYWIGMMQSWPAWAAKTPGSVWLYKEHGFDFCYSNITTNYCY